MSKNLDFSDATVNRYSLALYELAHESNSVNEIEEQSKSFISLIYQNEEMKYFIKNPTNKKEDQEKVINKISEQFKLNQLFNKFLCFLISKRRFFYVEKILSNFIKTCSKKRGEIQAELIAAKEMSENEIANIQNDLVKSFNSKIKLNFKNDPNLIGGLIIQVGSTMIDTSIKNKLQKIENKMLEV